MKTVYILKDSMDGDILGVYTSQEAMIPDITEILQDTNEINYYQYGECEAGEQLLEDIRKGERNWNRIMAICSLSIYDFTLKGED